MLGPMVYGCAYCPLRQKAALAERSASQLRTFMIQEDDTAWLPISFPGCLRAFADSKTLTEEKREALYEEIAEDASMGSAVDVLDARTISAQMLHRCGELSLQPCCQSWSGTYDALFWGMCSQKESLNVMANSSTFRLIEGALELGVNIREVRWCNLACGSLGRPLSNWRGTRHDLGWMQRSRSGVCGHCW